MTKEKETIGIMVDMKIQVTSITPSLSSLQLWFLYFESLTGSLTVTLASIKGNVAETATIFVPTSAKVDASIKSVLNEKPAWKIKDVLLKTQKPKHPTYLQ